MGFGNIFFRLFKYHVYTNVGEITVFIASFTGGLIGFLWFNTYSSWCFMGDTGSLTVGALISVIAIMVRKELLLPIICGIYLIEVLSVLIQVFYFKYTRKKKWSGWENFFNVSNPSSLSKKGIHESKITNRFLIIGVLLSVLAILTLKSDERVNRNLGSGESGKGAAILAKKAGYKVFVSDLKKFQNKQSHYLKNFQLIMKKIITR